MKFASESTAAADLARGTRDVIFSHAQPDISLVSSRSPFRVWLLGGEIARVTSRAASRALHRGTVTYGGSRGLRPKGKEDSFQASQWGHSRSRRRSPALSFVSVTRRVRSRGYTLTHRRHYAVPSEQKKKLRDARPLHFLPR